MIIEMTNRTRFCVLFCGIDERQPIKTRLLHSDSTREDILQIWKQLYDEEAPSNAELIIGGNCVYSLDDDEDLMVFLAQAEDQYKLLPSQPLKVILGNYAEYSRRQRDTSPISKSPSPTLTVSPKHHHSRDSAEFATDLTKKSSTEANRNNNNAHSEEDHPSPLERHNSSANIKQEPEVLPQAKSHTTSLWTPFTGATNPLMSLYNRYRGEEGSQPGVPKAFGKSGSNYGKTIGGVIESITSAATGPASMPTRENGFNGRMNGNSDVGQGQYENPYMAYTKQLAQALAASTANASTDLSKGKDSKPGLPETPTSGSLGKSPFNMSAYSAFMNSIQEQRQQLMQNGPSASYILQSIFNNHMKTSAQKQDAHKALSESRLNGPYLDHKPSPNGNFVPPQMLMTSPNHPSRSLQDNRSSSLLSSLAHHNSNSFLSYMNGGGTHGLGTGNGLEELVKHPKKKRRRNGMVNENGKLMDSSKRMRSSISQSNIEYHYQRALDYSQMAEEEQKMQNSAHRSHWKHLLYVAKRSPRFLEHFKHAKYDEWSSEARDIFAICQPDKYMWSFLTLSKQGDMLCKRIIAKIDGLLQKSTEERPEWCPEDDLLLRAQTRARERLSQLQRILYSRSLNQETKVTEKANEREKFSMHEKNLALVTAYHQRQQEIIQSHQAAIAKQAASMNQFHHQNQQEQSRSIPAANASSTTHCSSLTSSPVSMASPAFEENSSRSGCSDSPTPQQDMDHQNEGNLVIAEDKEQEHSPPTSEELEIERVSPQPFIKGNMIGLTSPHKWSQIEQAADV